MAQSIVARVCSVCLAAGPLLTLAYVRQKALRVRGPGGVEALRVRGPVGVGGGACKSGSIIAGVCPCPP